MNEAKETRQAALIQLLQERPLFSQKEICEAMESRGYPAAQPSISRDLNELGVVKISGRYLPPTTLSEQIPRSLTLSVHTAGPHLLVVRTKTGAAHAVAAQIDDLEVEGVAGTVAGDDTIFLAFDNSSHQEPALKYLTQRLL
ncbi:MAG: hypothetical protein KDD70_09810 [Bdellovibrionales bacterium]|nr:hypothetical protein [Bdellovibrionales bacterium]